MRESEKQPYHHGDLRRAIIDTAMQMLTEEGDWQFTLREIARRAGVSHAAPYKHFPDKAALLAEIALIGFDRLHEALAASQSTSADVSLTLAAMSHAYLEFGHANPALYRLMFGGDVGKDVHLDERALGPFELLISVLERGQAAGLISQAASSWTGNGLLVAVARTDDADARWPVAGRKGRRERG